MFILQFPINLTRADQNQPKGRMWPGGRKMPRYVLDIAPVGHSEELDILRPAAIVFLYFI